MHRVYDIQIAKGAEADLKKLAAFHRSTILNAIESSLSNEPTKPSRNRKVLVGLVPPWTAEPPIWELRVGAYRVFYDVADEEQVVYIRAIRKKPAGRTTEDIL
jgi:mRNA-degrading endonuclease RelE of RelBE toxin-antitoxin system